MLLRGDGEIDSVTDGQCGRCGGAVDQAGACHTCDNELAMTTPLPAPTAADAVEALPPVAVRSSESTRSDAVQRFGWDPSTDEMIARQPAPEPELEPEPRRTVAEASLPAPELEALFAALESSPIRIKPQEPEPPAAPASSAAADAAADSAGGRIVAQAPAISLPFARPFELEQVGASPASPEIEVPPDTMELPIAPQPTIALKRAIDFDAPVAPEPAHVIDDARVATPHDVGSVPSIDQILASHDVNAAIAAAAAPLSPEPTLSPAPIEPPTIVSAPPVIETLRAIDSPMPIATADETPALAWEVVAPPPLAAPPVAPPIVDSARPPVIAQSSAPRTSIRWRPLLTAGATVAILAVIGVPLSKLWLERAAAQPGVQPAASSPAPQHAPAARATTPAAAPSHAPQASPSPVPHVAAPPAPTSVPVASNTAVTVSPRPTATERPHPVLLSPDAQVPPRPARPIPAPPMPAPVPQPAPQLAALAPAVTAPSVAALPAATAEPEPAPAPVVATTPAAGPFFELNDVDRPPKVTARIDTELPADLAGQPLNEIVVVRVLVSQTGHPALVSLLRHSKAGLALDEAVIAAVKQWTFTPAMKRGQSVSCFYHVAVTVSQR